VDFIVNWLMQGCVVALTTSGVLRLLQSARAPARYVVCWAGLSAVLALPLVPVISSFIGQVPGAAVAATAASPLVSVPHTPLFGALIIGAWTVWLCVFAVRLATEMRAVRRTRQRCRSFPAIVERRLDHWRRLRHHGRPTELVVCDRIQTAAVIGCGSPVIAIAPALIEDLTADELDRVVVHEWAHVQRRDDIANVVQLTARVLAGWHPAVWWLDRRLQAERETACDEMAVALTGSSKAYAACLVKLAGLRFAWRETVPALGVLSSTGLATRVQRIVTSKRYASPGWSRNTVIVGIGLLAGVAFAIGSLRFVEAVVVSSELDSTRTVSQLNTAQIARGVPASIVHIPVSTTLSSGLREASKSRSRSRSAPLQAVATTSGTPVVTRATNVPPDSMRTPVTAGIDTEAPATDSIAVDTLVDAAPTDAAIPAGSLPVPKIQGVTPWAAAANAGIALGERSKNGGVAAAQLFSRFGKRIADSF
jgi:beta-lactamase regulating signal transducer with metallopeptidase domain